MVDWPRFDERRARLNDEGDAFLDAHRSKGILITNGVNGHAHAVPLGYFRVGDDLFMSGRRRTQRLANIARDPKVSFLVEDGLTMGDFQGLLIQGVAEVIRDDDEKLRVARAGAERRGLPEDQWPTEAPRGTLIRVSPRRFISWDNTRVPPSGS